MFLQGMQQQKQGLMQRLFTGKVRVNVDAESGPLQLGLMKGKLTLLAEDDEHLDDFQEYMP